METRLASLYELPDISQFQDADLLSLRQNCSMLESALHTLSDTLPDSDRYILEAYIDARDELEFETVKAALRWGKKNYK